MEPTIDIPLNTMLADLDESLRGLLVPELGRHGFSRVHVSFEAPTREWAAAVTNPTVNLFLHDIREAVKRRPIEWTTRRADGRNEDVRPPLRVEISYAVTAWARTVEDEHRMLSQLLGILYAYYELPRSALVGTLANGSQEMAVQTTVVQPKNEAKADFWSAIGGPFKASLEYVVRASCASGTRMQRGPDTGGQSFRFGERERDRDGVRSIREERHTLLGHVTLASGEPAAHAEVSLPEAGGATDADEHGRFRFVGLESGRYRCVARGEGGGESEVMVDVPGPLAELILPAVTALR